MVGSLIKPIVSPSRMRVCKMFMFRIVFKISLISKIIKKKLIFDFVSKKYDRKKNLKNITQHHAISSSSYKFVLVVYRVTSKSWTLSKVLLGTWSWKQIAITIINYSSNRNKKCQPVIFHQKKSQKTQKKYYFQHMTLTVKHISCDTQD